jgi:HIRAN domain
MSMRSLAAPDIDGSLSPQTYSLICVGERFANADGDNRQVELARSKPGERIDLVREPTNPYDINAVALVSCRGVQVGYLAREHAIWIAPMIDAGAIFSATVERVAPKGRPFAPLAVTIKLRFDHP